MLLSRDRNKERIIVRPGATPDDAVVCIFLLMDQIKFEAVRSLAFEQTPLAIARHGQQMLVILCKLKLDDCELVAG